MRPLSTLTLPALLPLLTSCPLAAETIELTVTFERGAPPAVLAWLPDDHSWRPTEAVAVDQREQVFRPLIAVVPPGGTLRIANSDSQQHNVFALDAAQGIDRDLGLAAPGASVTLEVTWPAGAVVRHGCKIHPQMQLWVAALDSAHAVAEIPDGTLSATLRLERAPAGARVTLWAPRCEPLTTAADSAPILRRGKPAGTLSVRRLP